MIKPIDEQEMLLRIKALLRQAKIVSEHRIEPGDAVLDYKAKTVTKDRESRTLPQKEFLLYSYHFSCLNPIFLFGSLTSPF